MPTRGDTATRRGGRPSRSVRGRVVLEEVPAREPRVDRERAAEPPGAAAGVRRRGRCPGAAPRRGRARSRRRRGRPPPGSGSGASRRRSRRRACRAARRAAPCAACGRGRRGRRGRPRRGRPRSRRCAPPACAHARGGRGRSRSGRARPLRPAVRAGPGAGPSPHGRPAGRASGGHAAQYRRRRAPRAPSQAGSSSRRRTPDSRHTTRTEIARTTYHAKRHHRHRGHQGHHQVNEPHPSCLLLFRPRAARAPHAKPYPPLAVDAAASADATGRSWRRDSTGAERPRAQRSGFKVARRDGPYHGPGSRQAHPVVVSGGWLGDRDSNPDSMVQSHVSYRWTISQRRRPFILAKAPRDFKPPVGDARPTPL